MRDLDGESQSWRKCIQNYGDSEKLCRSRCCIYTYFTDCVPFNTHKSSQRLRSHLWRGLILWEKLLSELPMSWVWLEHGRARQSCSHPLGLTLQPGWAEGAHSGLDGSWKGLYYVRLPYPTALCVCSAINSSWWESQSQVCQMSFRFLEFSSLVESLYCFL